MIDVSDKVYVFGAGTFGLEIAEILSNYGFTVLGIIDNFKTGKLGKWEIKHPEEVDRSTLVALGICNFAVDLKDISRSLDLLGFSKYLTPVQLFKFLSDKGLHKEHYWLTTEVEIYRENEKEIEQFRKLLFDQESKDLLDALISYRKFGEIENLPDVSPISHQYLPKDISIVPQPLHLVDCGAYFGEFIDYAKQRGFSLDTIYAFEPDPTNFKELVGRISKLPSCTKGFAYPLGVSDTTKQVKFSADGSLGAAISDNGEVVVQVISLDQVLKNVPINYIKMDIEGAEFDALVGCSRIIKEQIPHLAISVYHKPKDIWEIGLWLNSLNLGYKFILRQYGHQCFDTVLYAFKESV